MHEPCRTLLRIATLRLHPFHDHLEVCPADSGNPHFNQDTALVHNRHRDLSDSNHAVFSQKGCFHVKPYGLFILQHHRKSCKGDHDFVRNGSNLLIQKTCDIPEATRQGIYRNNARSHLIAHCHHHPANL